MNSVLSNFHTHTSYCDGTDTPRDFVAAALRKDFRALGFSGHSSDAVQYGMNDDAMELYRMEIESLKREYDGRIEIYAGMEVDSTCKSIPDWVEYTIGSVHMLNCGGVYYFVDNTQELFDLCINEGFNGDAYALAQAYYAELERHVREIRADIVGHFDLLTKYNADGCFFDTADSRYTDAAFDALESIVGLGCIVEVNTGGMAKGLTKSPYPDSRLLTRVRELGGNVMINSDAHSVDKLAYGFTQAAELLRAAGFDERMELVKGEFVPVPL